jgi:XisH protein
MGRQRYVVDLGAERLLAAEKAGQQIAVEIKVLSATLRWMTLRKPSINMSYIELCWLKGNQIGLCTSPFPKMYWTFSSNRWVNFF